MNQSGGLYDLIDMDYVLAGAKSKLGIRESTAEDMFLMDAINFCLVNKLKNFGVQTYSITQIPIEHDSTPRAKLPKGFIRFVQDNPIIYVNAAGMSIAGTTSEVVTNTYVTDGGEYLGSTQVETGVIRGAVFAPTFVNNTFYKDSPFDANLVLGGTVTQMDGYLYFSSNVTADFVKIAYLGVNFGENGKIVMPAYTEEALVSWACKEWSSTQFLITGEQRFRIAVQDFKDSFIIGRNKAKATPLMPSSLEYKIINYISASLI